MSLRHHLINLRKIFEDFWCGCYGKFTVTIPRKTLIASQYVDGLKNKGDRKTQKKEYMHQKKRAYVYICSSIQKHQQMEAHWETNYNDQKPFQGDEMRFHEHH